MKLCECGCNTKIKNNRRFVLGHHARTLKKSPEHFKRYMKEYNQRPYVKANKSKYKNENRQRPDVKAKRRIISMKYYTRNRDEINRKKREKHGEKKEKGIQEKSCSQEKEKEGRCRRTCSTKDAANGGAACEAPCGRP